jgi:hypothetical protein
MSKRVTIVAIIAAAAVFAAIAISQAASTPLVRGKPAQLDRTSRARVASMLYRRYSVLRSVRAGAAESGTGLGAEYAEHLTEPGTLLSEYELVPAQARAVEVGGSRVWVIPGAAGICLGTLTSDGAARGTACATLAEAGTDGLLMSQRPAAGPVIYGLVPNGDSVIVTNVDHSSSRVAVVDNVVKVADPSAEAVALDAPDGRAIQTAKLAGDPGE